MVDVRYREGDCSVAVVTVNADAEGATNDEGGTVDARRVNERRRWYSAAPRLDERVGASPWRAGVSRKTGRGRST